MDQTREPIDQAVRGAGPPVYGDAAARSRDRSAGGEEAEGIGTLVSGLIGDLQEIVRGEVRLAKAELREDATAMGRGAAMLATGALVGLTGFIFLMLAATYLLDEAIEEFWISAGIVALALLVVAAILAMVGRNRLSAANLKPEETIESLKEDREWARQQISSVKR